ncbi:unnamed protein product [Closterium sp. NIES-54]
MLPSPSTPQRPLSHSPPFTRPLPTSARAAKAFARVVALQQRVQHYRDLGGFVVLMALFITILYLQADSSISHEITSAHAVLYPPHHSGAFSYPPLHLCLIAPHALGACFVLHTHAYLPPTHAASQPSLVCIKARTLIGPCAPHCPPLSLPPLQKPWADPTCGSGTCDRPFQYPAFGRFGCEADCGTFPNLTSVVIRLSSQLDTQQAADESSWNLCMVNPVSLCWYARPPPAALLFLLSPSCVLIPPHPTPPHAWRPCGAVQSGGIRGTVHAPPPGTRRFSIVGAASTIELAAWGYCTHDDDVDAASCQAVSGSIPGVCTCRPLPLPVSLGGYGRTDPLLKQALLSQCRAPWYASSGVAQPSCPALPLCPALACLDDILGWLPTVHHIRLPATHRQRLLYYQGASLSHSSWPSSIPRCLQPEIAILFSNIPCNVSGTVPPAPAFCLELA